MALGKPNPSVGVELKKPGNEEEKKSQPKSKLDQGVQDLISFIFDMNLIE